MAVNVRGTFLCYKYAAQQMIKQGRGGRIIGASSISGKLGKPLLAAYSTSKFAIRGLTQTAGKDGVSPFSSSPADRISTGAWSTQHYGKHIRSWSDQDANE